MNRPLWSAVRAPENRGWILLVVALGLLPLTTENDFYLNLMVFIFLYGGLATAWSILGGMAGQFSLGHTAFFGIGAYTSTLLYVYAGVSPWLGLIVGGLLSAVVAVLIAYPAFRLRGVFFAMATLALGEVARIFLVYARRHTEIPYGISINYVPNWQNVIFEGRRPYVYLALGYLLVVLATAIYFNRSHIGYYLRALRDNEEAATALGVFTRRYKLIALVVSAIFTAVGGTVAAQYILYIEPESVFTVELSVQLALMAILGGVGVVAGPLLGAAIVLVLQEFLQATLGNSAAGAYLLIYALVLIAIVILAPDGILGGMDRWWRRRRLRSVKEPTTEREVRPVA